jgi:hypothetical protein
MPYELEAEQDDDGDWGVRTDIADPGTMRVRLCARRCDTCVFRPGNLMHLTPTGLRSLVEAATQARGHITCHDTLLGNERDLPGAVCRGWEQHPNAQGSLFMRWLRLTGLVTLVDPATGELTDADYNALPPLED